MNRVVKRVLKGVVILHVVVLAVVLTLPLWIGPAVKQAAAVGGPKALGVPVSVGDVKLSPFSGTLTISQVKVGNPQGYSDKDAFAVDQIEVGLNLGSLMGDTIVVRKILIDSPAISYEVKDGKSNFDVMLASTKKSAEEEKAAKDGEKKPGKKVIIEEFTLKGAKVSYASAVTFGKPVTLPLPPVTLRDIGKGSDGTSFADALSEVMNGILGGLSKAVTQVADKAGELLKGVGGSASDAAKGATDALKGAADGAAGAAKDAAKSLKSLFK